MSLLPTIAEQIGELRALIAELSARNDCACGPEGRACESCRRLIRRRDELRELEATPEGRELLARELDDLRLRAAERTRFEVAFVGPRHYTDPATMNDELPF